MSFPKLFLLFASAINAVAVGIQLSTSDPSLIWLVINGFFAVYCFMLGSVED